MAALNFQKDKFTLEPHQNLKGGIVAGIVVGLVVVVAGVLTQSPTRVWNALLMNVFFFFSIALGGVVFSGIQDVVGALWSRPIKRIHESFAAFIPVAAGLLVVFLLSILFDVAGARGVYIWMVKPSMLDAFPGKRDWLKPAFMVFRDLFALGVVVFLSNWQLRTSVRRDVLMLAGDKAAESEAELAKQKLRYWCAPILLCYALCYSLLAFDLVMSLSPTWFSTLWAGWMFAIMMQTLMATLLVFLFALRHTPVGQVYQRVHFHDVGKLMHGFTIFFAYLTYAHVLTYWYGNVPEETEYFIERLKGPWFWIICVSPFFSFLIPLYTLIFKAAKWTAPVTLSLCGMILVSQWFAYSLIFIPVADHHWSGFWIDLGLLAFVAAAFLASFARFSQRFPMLGISDPLLKEALAAADHH